MKCTNCGMELPGGTMTCPNCGCKIDPRAMFHTVKDESEEPDNSVSRPASREPERAVFGTIRPAGGKAERPSAHEPERPGYGSGRSVSPEPVRPGYDADMPTGYDPGMDEPTVSEPMYTPRPAADKASAVLSGAVGAAGGAIGGAIGKAASGRKPDKRILAIGAIVVLLLGVLVFKVLAKDPIIGTWEATEIIENGTSYTSEELGDSGARLVCGENHTATMIEVDLYDGSTGDSMSGRWDKNGRGEYTITMSAGFESWSADVHISGRTLTISMGADRIVFKKQ